MKKKMKKKKKKPKSTESQWMSSSSAWTTEKVVKLALSDEDVRPPMGLDCPALTAEEVRRPCSSKPDVKCSAAPWGRGNLGVLRPSPVAAIGLRHDQQRLRHGAAVHPHVEQVQQRSRRCKRRTQGTN
eukprot:scaffold436_cov267-Pinguiococcus_pyrenoidosus.AAC.4